MTKSNYLSPLQTGSPAPYIISSMWSSKSPGCLNPFKTVCILKDLREELREIIATSISFNLHSAFAHIFTGNSPIRNLQYRGPMCNLCFCDHITQLSCSCLRHIRDFRRTASISLYSLLL